MIPTPLFTEPACKHKKNVTTCSICNNLSIKDVLQIGKIKKYIKGELIRIQNGKQKYITPLLEFIMNLIKN